MPARDVVIAILAKDKAMYLPLYLECLASQTWPKSRVHLYIRSNDNKDDTIDVLRRWLARFGREYASVHEDYTPLDESLKRYAEHEWNAHRFEVLGDIRQRSVDYARRLGCHYFVADCDNFIQPEVVETLVGLVEAGFPVVAPLLVTASDRYANLHVETDENGYFVEGQYYEPIRSRSLRGVFKVDVVHCTYMIGWEAQQRVSYADGSQRYEYIVLSDVLRKAGVSQYVDNRRDYGRLSQCHGEEEFSRELRAWAGQFACFREGEPAGYVRSLLERYAGNATRTYRTELGTFTVFCNEEFIAAPMKHGRAWEQELLEMLLPTLSGTEDVLDVGAHVGTHSVPYARRARHVHAFEPQAQLHELLLKNLETNGCTNVTAYPSAVGHARRPVCMSTRIADGGAAGATILYGDPARAMNYGGTQLSAEGSSVQMRTLDELELDAVRHLKVDTEGAEPLVFWGARSTIHAQRPLILYEQNQKRLEREVLDRLEVPAAARDFRVADFARDLGYHDPVELSDHNLLLLPMRSRALAAKLVETAWTGGAFYADERGRVWCKMAGRGDFPAGVLDGGTLCVWFGDVNYLFTGSCASRAITWNNQTTWEA